MQFDLPAAPAAALSTLTSLHGRVALVTGGAQGIGKAIANRLAEAGAAVAIADLDVDRAVTAAAAIAADHGVETVGVSMDVADLASVEAGAAQAIAALGGLDVWVNNAGLFPSEPLDLMTDEAWDRVFAVNVRGTRNGCRVAASELGARDGGVIVNLVSLAGFEGVAPGLSAYVASKHAVRGLTRQLAIELAPAGIRVLGVAPTFVMTEGTMAAAAAAMAKGDDAVVGSDGGRPAMPAPSTLIGRLGTPDDIARVVLFCATDLSAVMTGSTLLADAGATA